MKKTVVITGTNSGIGKALAHYCVKMGYHVINICRKSKKSEQAYQELLEEKYDYMPEIIYGDLSSKAEIERIIHEIQASVDHIDLLINNAGVLKLKQEYSVDGIEMTMAVNLIAVYRLTEKLLNIYKPFHIINMTSELFKKGEVDINELDGCESYKGSKRYNDSKKGLLYYTSSLSKRLEGQSKVVAMHPGVVASNAFRDYPRLVVHMFNLFLEKPELAAEKIMEPYRTDKMNNGFYYQQNKQKEKLDTFVDDYTLATLLNKLKQEYF